MHMDSATEQRSQSPHASDVYCNRRINVHVRCILNSWAYQSRHATENWKNESGQSSVMLKNAFDFYVE